MGAESAASPPTGGFVLPVVGAVPTHSLWAGATGGDPPPRRPCGGQPSLARLPRPSCERAPAQSHPSGDPEQAHRFPTPCDARPPLTLDLASKSCRASGAGDRLHELVCAGALKLHLRLIASARARHMATKRRVPTEPHQANNSIRPKRGPGEASTPPTRGMLAPCTRHEPPTAPEGLSDPCILSPRRMQPGRHVGPKLTGTPGPAERCLSRGAGQGTRLEPPHPEQPTKAEAGKRQTRNISRGGRGHAGATHLDKKVGPMKKSRCSLSRLRHTPCCEPLRRPVR